MLNAVRRLCGQLSTFPIDLFDQSTPRRMAPASPPPKKGSPADEDAEGPDGVTAFPSMATRL
jgi:hypothetical protein